MSKKGRGNEEKRKTSDIGKDILEDFGKKESRVAATGCGIWARAGVLGKFTV